MAREYIEKLDTLNDGRKKLNRSINKSYDADQKSDEAITNSHEAKTTAKSVREELNQVVIEGDSSVEAAQARVDTNGESHQTLKTRIDAQQFVVSKVAPLNTNFWFEIKGGRNYLRNTGVGSSEPISMFGSQMEAAGSSLITGNEYYTLESTSSSGEVRYRAMAQGTLPSGLSGTWTFSGVVLIPEGTSGVPYTRTQIAIDPPTVWTNAYRNGERLINATKGIWTEFVHTFDIPGGSQSLHIGIKFANDTQKVGDKIHFKNLKLERGNIATDWKPSPEDIL